MPVESASHPVPDDEPDSVGLLVRTLDDVIAAYADDVHEGEVSQARQEYEARRGRVFEDEELWEPWTQAFLEWYAIERPLAAALDAMDTAGLPAAPALGSARRGGGGVRARIPAARYLREHADDERRARALRAWLTSHRSLFEVRALAGSRVELIDLIGGGRFSVAERRGMAGVAVGDVAELRLLGFEERVVFGRTFCFHPTGTRAAIASHIVRLRAEGASPGDIIDHCASLRIRCERYQHVAPVRIYESPPRAGNKAGA